MKRIYIALRMLTERAGANIMLLAEILLSIILFAQMTVFIAGFANTREAVERLPAEGVTLVCADIGEGQTVAGVMSEIAAEPEVAQVETVFASYCRIGGDSGRGAFNLAAYTEGLAEEYRPALAAGKWLTDSHDTDGRAPVAVTADSGFFVGDEITLSTPGGQIEARVCGVLAKHELFICPTRGGGREAFTSDMLLYQENAILVLARDVPECEKLAFRGKFGMPQDIFVRGSGKPGDEEAQLARFGEVIDMAGANRLYFDENNRMIRAGVVTFGVIFLVALMGLVSSLIAQMEKSRRRFIVYYLGGMSWQDCGAIEAIRMFVLLAGTWLLTWGAGRAGLLMAEWVPVRFAEVFYGAVALYPAVTLALAAWAFISQILKTDISVQLKLLSGGE